MLSTAWIAPVALITALAAPLEYEKLAPFTAVRWAGDRPEVQVDGAWRGIRSIDEVSIDDILAFSKKEYGSKWQKRFSEDLVELLSAMGHPPGDVARLALTDLATGDVETVTAVMTRENRAAVLLFNRGKGAPPGRDQTPRPATLGEGDVAADLDALLAMMEARHSYFRLKGVDAPAEIQAIKERLTGTTPLSVFALELTRFLARFGDGHSRLTVDPDDVFDRGYLPFLIGIAGDRRVAFHADRRGLLDPAFPYVVQMDGRPIEDWMNVAAQVAPDGSPQLKQDVSARNLRYLEWTRQELGLPTGVDVRVTLGAARGKKTKDRTFPVADRRPIYGAWPRGESRLLDGNIGYLRLPEMVSPEEDRALFEDLRRHMTAFQDARGLIIDVRGNGGGTRDLLTTLLPYFLDPREGPRVVNVAAKRLEAGDDPSDPRGLLGSSRGLFPADSPNHSPAAKQAIEAFKRGFQPKWTLPKGEFSDWHYMVVSPTAEDGTYFYRGRVAVLVDPACFSATDVFAAAFRGVPNVILVGTPTGGGSGQSRPVKLPRSGIELNLSSMVSFQWDGNLFDGVGVPPDLLVQPEPTDFIGETDTVLEAAIEVLKEPRR